MNFKRIGRILVCLVLVCALLINISPIKAKADVVSGGLVAAGATGAVVSVPVAIAIGATLIALGIIADAASQNPYALQNLASEVGDALAAAGTYVQDGMVEMYRFLTDTGEAVYYAASDFMEAVRTYCLTSGVLLPGVSCDLTLEGAAEALATAQTFPYYYIGTKDDGVYCIGWGRYPFTISKNEYGTQIAPPGGTYCKRWDADTNTIYQSSETYILGVSIYTKGVNDLYHVDDGLTLAAFPSSVIDGTSARTWSEAYANRGLYIASGGSQNPDDGGEGNDGWKFLLPLAFLAGVDLWAMSQADQWTGSTPPEFEDYSTKEELTVSPAPEFDGYQAIEIAPAPNTNPDPGTGSDLDAGGDSAEQNWWQRFSQWFLDIRTAINELPNRFDEHFENVNNNIQEVPNKFETWIQNVQSSVDALAENILGTADEINATINELPNTFFGQLPVLLSAIAAVPEAILAGLRSLFQELFVPSQEYMNNKLQELVQAYPYLQPIISLGDTFKAYLNGVNPTPPVIWIDLGASQWYPLGGRVKFIDLTWYAQYKPTVDGILGAFLWLCFLWRLFQSAPGIVRGASGLFGSHDSHPDVSFSQNSGCSD